MIGVIKVTSIQTWYSPTWIVIKDKIAIYAVIWQKLKRNSFFHKVMEYGAVKEYVEIVDMLTLNQQLIRTRSNAP